MNPVENEFYKVLNPGWPDEIYFKYYLLEANNCLKEMNKKKRNKLNVRFKKETKKILEMDEHHFKKYNNNFVMFLKDRYEYEVKDELYSNCPHNEKKMGNV